MCKRSGRAKVRGPWTHAFISLLGKMKGLEEKGLEDRAPGVLSGARTPSRKLCVREVKAVAAGRRPAPGTGRAGLPISWRTSGQRLCTKFFLQPGHPELPASLLLSRVPPPSPARGLGPRLSTHRAVQGPPRHRALPASLVGGEWRVKPSTVTSGSGLPGTEAFPGVQDFQC